MSAFERLGVNTKWAKSWRAVVKNTKELIEANYPDIIHKLEGYVVIGEVASFGSSSVPKKKWEGSALNTALGRYGMWRLREFELHSINEDNFETALARRAFTATFTSEMLRLQWEERFQEIYNGAILESMGLEKVAYTALGIVIGCKEEAFILARIQLSAHRKRYYSNRQAYPIFHFMLRILADYLKEPPVKLHGGEAENEPICQALFKNWRTTDLDVLTSICLAACDFHTHRCQYSDRHFYEFHNEDWTHIPIEILLLFKLRQLSGLENPKLDHPLMNTALGVLPEEVTFEPDDLIRRVRERMQQDGYDEKDIVALYKEPQFISNRV